MGSQITLHATRKRSIPIPVITVADNKHELLKCNTFQNA